MLCAPPCIWREHVRFLPGLRVASRRPGSPGFSGPSGFPGSHSFPSSSVCSHFRCNFRYGLRARFPTRIIPSVVFRSPSPV